LKNKSLKPRKHLSHPNLTDEWKQDKMMKSRFIFIVQFLAISLGIGFFGLSITLAAMPAPPQNENPQVNIPGRGSPETLRVAEGKSMVLNTGAPVKRVSVTNDQIVTAITVAPNQVLIHGLKSGVVTLILWDEQEQVRAFDLQVQAIPMNLAPLRNTLGNMLPSEKISISQSGSSVVLTGTASSQNTADQAASLAKTYFPNVVDMLSVPTPPMNQTVMLEVKFAEVQRNAAQQLGMNILSTGALNTPGAISTQQFSPPGVQSINSAIGSSLGGFSSSIQLTDILNIFAFRPDLNVGVMIKALQQRNLLETLAEPNLLAQAGKEASFLAGGEFPVPIIQGATGTPTVSVQFKEFGVRLKFVANPNLDGTINLRVAPEVSSLDFTNAVTLSGFLIPALTTRRADTELQLKDGQSFAIAGLLDNRVQKIDSKIPWLGDVPILGYLFKSKNFSKSKSELLVVVTPHIVKPLDPGQLPPMPSFPVPFLDAGKSEEKTGNVPSPR
jgi:pilus assembly protein CpaC